MDQSSPAATKVQQWFLSRTERGNPSTVVDESHGAEQAWSTGNEVRPLVHGATYFAELYERLEGTREGDLVLFTDWQGDADEQLDGTAGSEVGDVLARADERGVDVRGLIWRSHGSLLGFTAGENRHLGKVLQDRGAEALLDMRVRWGGSHHQKMVVIRYRDDPARDIAYIGGIDLCHSRRDDRDHAGDPQPLTDMAHEYGDTPPWHDLQAAITGPAVRDAETVFRERWEDPTPLSRSPLRAIKDRLFGMDLSPDPLPMQQPAPPPVEGGTHAVQLLRTYPDLRLGRDYPFARGGERSVARGYTKAVERARRLIYVEDQYLWGSHVGEAFVEALTRHEDLHVIAVLPLYTDGDGALKRTPQLLGRRRAMLEMMQIAPDRVAVYGIENSQGRPIYVHAKTCNVDDTWVTIGSDNFNRRSWTHDSELSAAVVDTNTEDPAGFARGLRLTLAAEHLGRPASAVEDGTMSDCVDPHEMFALFDRSAAALDGWHAGGRRGTRPDGRLRRLAVPQLGRATRAWSYAAYLTAHDPDGRPRRLRRSDGF